MFLVLVLAALPGLLSCTSAPEAGADNLVQLTSDSGDEYYPDWSPDGTSIAFEKAESPSGPYEAWIMQADGSQKRKLQTPHQAGAPVFSPDGDRIAYVAFMGLDPIVIEIWAIDTDGRNPRPLAAEPGWSMELPKWSPDGSQLAYARGRNINESELWTMNSDGSGKTELLNDLTGWLDCDWEPNGNRIVFESLPDIWIINADGTGLRQLTSSVESLESRPTWSPDGKKILFESEQHQSNGDILQGLETMNPDGTGREFILSSDANSNWESIGEPAWSPDGNRIAFVAKNKTEDNLFDIWVLTLDD